MVRQSNKGSIVEKTANRQIVHDVKGLCTPIKTLIWVLRERDNENVKKYLEDGKLDEMVAQADDVLVEILARLDEII